MLRTLVVFILVGTFYARAQALQADLPNINTQLQESLADPLIFLGSYIPSYSISHKIPTCVFKNSKVMVKYSYCTADDVPATEITIHSAGGFQISIYAETNSSGDITNLDRSKYLDEFWEVSSLRNGIDPRNFSSIQEYQKFDEENTTAAIHFGCVTGGTLSPKVKRTVCENAYQQQRKSWLLQALPFWNKPGPSWYQLNRYLKDQTKSSTCPRAVCF